MLFVTAMYLILEAINYYYYYSKTDKCLHDVQCTYSGSKLSCFSNELVFIFFSGGVCNDGTRAGYFHDTDVSKQGKKVNKTRSSLHYIPFTVL